MTSINSKSEPKPARRKASQRDTQSRRRFLSAAEYLFAELGYEGTRIRAIAERSKVNLGALHHYWGNKEELFKAVCENCFIEMNKERMRRFDELEEQARTSGTPIAMRALFRATIEPTFFTKKMSARGLKIYLKFYGRTMTEPSPPVQKVMLELFSPVSQRFLDMLRELCPHLSDDEFYWRAGCIFGAFIYVPAFTERIAYYFSPDHFDGKDYQFAVSQMLDFLVAGMQAPSSPEDT